MSDRRRRLGELGEQIARRHLTARGFEIVDCNFRTRFGEIDLVARDRRFLVFCEVKTRIGRERSTPFAPLVSVGWRKQRQVRRMAVQWLGQRAGTAGAGELRFDAIGVTLSPGGRLIELEHLEGAF